MQQRFPTHCLSNLKFQKALRLRRRSLFVKLGRIIRKQKRNNKEKSKKARRFIRRVNKIAPDQKTIQPLNSIGMFSTRLQSAVPAVGGIIALALPPKLSIFSAYKLKPDF